VDNIPIDREIRNVIDIIKPLANMNSVVITSRLQRGIVRGNVRHFQQCFLNLIKNSIEAMPNGGELYVITTSTKSAVTIKVVDNGVGMNKEQIHRFGEPYYSSKEKGTGLGSMVVVRTIQTMKGMLEIDSTVNEGTAITVKFPVYD
jgi:two-component system sporulation sensor kinase B